MVWVSEKYNSRYPCHVVTLSKKLRCVKNQYYVVRMDTLSSKHASHTEEIGQQPPASSLLSHIIFRINTIDQPTAAVSLSFCVGFRMKLDPVNKFPSLLDDLNLARVGRCQ